MARKAVGERRKRIVDHLARMLIHYLREHAFQGATSDEMIRRTGLTTSIINTPWWSDVPEICEATSLDIGLTIRDQKGNEVTLWPSENLGDGYKPRKAAGKKAERPDPSHYTNPKPHLKASRKVSNR